MSNVFTRTEIEQYEAAFASRAAGVAQMAEKVVSLTAEPDVKKLYMAEKYGRQMLREVAVLRRLEAQLSGVKARLAALEAQRVEAQS